MSIISYVNLSIEILGCCGNLASLQRAPFISYSHFSHFRICMTSKIKSRPRFSLKHLGCVWANVCAFFVHLLFFQCQASVRNKSLPVVRDNQNLWRTINSYHEVVRSRVGKNPGNINITRPTREIMGNMDKYGFYWAIMGNIGRLPIFSISYIS